MFADAHARWTAELPRPWDIADVRRVLPIGWRNRAFENALAGSTGDRHRARPQRSTGTCDEAVFRCYSAGPVAGAGSKVVFREQVPGSR